MAIHQVDASCPLPHADGQSPGDSAADLEPASLLWALDSLHSCRVTSIISDLAPVGHHPSPLPEPLPLAPGSRPPPWPREGTGEERWAATLSMMDVHQA